MPESLETLFHAAKTALAQNDPRRAMMRAHQAWSIDPSNADCCNLVGVCAISLGDGASAERCWLQAIALAPSGHEAHFNLAQYYLDTEKLDAAESYLRQTIALAPGHAAAWSRLASLLATRKRREEAEQCFKKAIGYNPADASTYAQLGLLLSAQKRREEAEACYRTSVRLLPGQAETHANLALLLEASNRLDEAEVESKAALRLKPESPEIHANLGNLLARMDRNAEAERFYRSALRLDPDSAIAHSNLGVLLAYSLRDNEAEQHFRQALALDCNYQLARQNLAMLLLAQGRLGEAWPFHEARYHLGLPEPDARTPVLAFPQWQGESLAGKSLLIWPEQGYGDMIQFCRYLPLLKQNGAKSITLVCRGPLVEFLQTLRGVDLVLAHEHASSLPGVYDYWTLPMSLPLHFHTELATIPAALPYLQSSPERRAKWSPKLASSGNILRVGLILRGNPWHANDSKRSLFDPTILQPLWNVQQVQFYNPQFGAQIALPKRVADLGADITDFADTAAIIDQLDLLITVDTAAAHVAGALGKPCWVLLPAMRTDWRWMRDRIDSPWYPNTMRLYRQAAHEDWGPVITRVATDLESRSSQHR